MLLTAPTMPVTINMGMEMPSWYDITSLDTATGQKLISQSDLQSSSLRIQSHLQKEIEILKGDSRKVFLGGFSQGGSLSLFSGLGYEQILGGICACSACLFESVEVEKLDTEKREIPILLYHGEMDPMVMYNYAVDSYKPLHNLEFNVKFHSEKELGHSFSLKELEILKEYFHKYMEPQI